MSPSAWLHAHRGASWDAPENTLAAFRLGLEQGADGIELDVQLSADGVPIVIHDATLGRTTGQSALVRMLPAADITRLDTLPSWSQEHVAQAATFKGRDTVGETCVPTLESVLAWLPVDCGLVIDVKDAAAVPVIAPLLEQRPPAARTVGLISFLPNAVDAAHGLLPWLSTGLLLDEGDPLDDGIDWAASHGHASVVPFEADLGGAAKARRIVEAAGRRGITIGCYVVNDRRRATALFNAGIAFLMSDCPARVLGGWRDAAGRHP